jgi:hypothetical protein
VSARPPHDHPDWTAAVAPEVQAVVRGSGRSMALAGIGFLLLLVALAGWWAQDLVGTLANEGEADLGSEVAFAAEAGTYRVITSGPLKPELERTVCDVELANERRLRILGGTGEVNPVETFGTSRVVQFDAPAGRTRVRCTDRLSPRYTGGRVQVVAVNGPVRYGLNGLAVAGALALAAGILAFVLRARRA